jgi:TPR repeat protein
MRAIKNCTFITSLLCLIFAGCTSKLDRCATGDEQACQAVDKELDKSRQYAPAIPALESGCNKGSVTACLVAGAAFHFSIKPADNPRAISLLDRACEMNSAIGCNVLGNVMVFDDSATREKIQNAFEKACKLSQNECDEFNEWKSKEDAFEKQLPSLKSGCEHGSGHDCWQIADLMMQNRWKLGEALTYAKRGCANHNQEACFGVDLLQKTITDHPGTK